MNVDDGRVGVLAVMVSASATARGGELDRLGQPPSTATFRLTGTAERGPAPGRRAQAAVGEGRGTDAAGELAQLVEHAGKLVGDLVQLRVQFCSAGWPAA